MIARVAEIAPSPAPQTRMELVELGRALLLKHADPEHVVSAFLKAYECDPIARYEFGDSLFTYFDRAKPDAGELHALLGPICDHPDQILVPDLTRRALTYAMLLPAEEESAQILLKLAAQADYDTLFREGEKARTMAVWWAATHLFQAFLKRPESRLQGVVAYSRVAESQLHEGRYADAARTLIDAQKLDPDAKHHLGSMLFNFLEAASPTLDDLEAIVDIVEKDEDVVVPDVRRMLLIKVLAFAKEQRGLDLAARLARLLSEVVVTRIGDGALGNGDHDSARFCYETAVKRDPEDMLLRLQLGITEFLANNHKKAEAHFNVLASTQAAARDRWGVSDLKLRILHASWIQAFGHITLLDTYIKAMKMGWLPEIRSILPFDRTNPPPGWPLLRYFAKYIDVVGVAGKSNDVIDELVFGEEPEIPDFVERLADGEDEDSESPAGRAYKRRVENWVGLDRHQRAMRRVSLMNFFWSLPDRDGRMRYISDYSGDVQRAWKAAGHGPLLQISDEERMHLRNVLAHAFGMPKDAWFVLLHVREPGFKPGWDSRHSYTRNASIDDYQEAIDLIQARGGWVVRGGDPSMRPFKPNARVIDYATSPFRSPELDILLCAECHFFLGTNSGFSLTPPLFGKRCVLTNWSPLGNPNWYPDDIFIPKLVRERDTGRYLTLEEMYGSKAGWSQFTRDFQDKWEKLDNDPAELRLVTEEMLDLLDGSYAPSAEDDDRQGRYEAIVERYEGYLGSRLSDRFLQQNEWLLGPAAAAAHAAE